MVGSAALKNNCQAQLVEALMSIGSKMNNTSTSSV
jgi:hypothetical protein